MAKKFSTKDVKIVSADAETETSVEPVAQNTISPDLSSGSTVSQDGKTGTVIWEGHDSGKKKIKIKWEDGSMSFHLFE